MSFGFVFETKLPEEKDSLKMKIANYLYHIGHACDDEKVLKEPILINNKKDFDKLIEKVLHQDEESFISVNKNAVNSNTKAIGIYQLFVKIFTLNDPIGSQIKLPDVLLKSKNVYTALNTITHEDDKLCFWRCLAKHYHQNVHIKQLIKASKDLYYKYYGKDVKHKDYLGVNIHELENIELFLRIFL